MKKTLVKVWSTVEKKKKSCSNKQFIYIFLFQENIYGIAYNRLKKKVNYKTFYFKNNLNFLKIKRLIKKIHQFNFLSFLKKKDYFSFADIKEVIVILFDFLFLLRSKKSLKKENQINTYQSIHSIFYFMENRFDNSTSFLDITIPYFFHPEILIRILRRHIKDIPFLHFLRLLFHKKKKLNLLNIETFFHLKKNQFFCFLWNFYTYEFEYFLNDIWKKFYKFESLIFWNFLDKTNSIKKMNHILKTSKKSIKKNIIKKINSIQYIRYQNNLIISLNDNNILILQTWKDFFLLFWQKYFNIWFKPSRILIKNFSKNSFFFLGYIFRIRNQKILIQIQIRNYFTNVNLIQKEFCSIIPIVPLIRFLNKEKFCDILGRPLCKLPWTTLSDNEIFERFNEIIKNIFSYYSGCSNKKGLYNLQYIFRFSCAKTLACKHKSTIRTVWKKYGSNLLTKSVSLKKTQLISLNFWEINPYKKKFWYLNIFQVNYLAHLLQKFKVSKK